MSIASNYIICVNLEIVLTNWLFYCGLYFPISVQVWYSLIARILCDFILLGAGYF